MRDNLRCNIHLSLLTLLLSCSIARAQTIDPRDAEGAQAKLSRQVEHLQPLRYRQAAPEIHDRVAAHAHKSFPVQLLTGVGNAIIATCGPNCDQIEISIYDYQRTLLARSNPEKRDTVIIYGNPRQSGLHEVDVIVPGCRAAECEVGLMVLRQEPSPKVASHVNYKRYDSRDLWGGDINTLKDIDAENRCASACSDNKQCRAYSFDKWRHACFLKAEIGSLALMLDPASVVGIRVDIADPKTSTDAARIERLPGRRFTGDVYKDTTVTVADKCQSTCESDDACIAFTFQKNGGSCRLFASANAYAADNASVSGAKIQRPLAAHSTSTARASDKKPQSGCANIAGYWRWFNGATVGVNADGTTQPSPTGIHGEWKCADGVFVFKWSHGFTDRLTLSADHRRLSGSNNVGVRVWGVRKTD